ncbi:MAG TPA: hypothetical protein VF618_11145 [Thermoanaerobaculia bacterium]
MLRSVVVACAFVVAALSARVADYEAAIVDRQALRLKVDPWDPAYRRFVAELPRMTAKGETVAVVLSAARAPVYFHAIKVLAGRQVISINGATGKAMERAGEADLVAVWPETLGVPAPFREVARLHGGIVARR